MDAAFHDLKAGAAQFKRAARVRDGARLQLGFESEPSMERGEDSYDLGTPERNALRERLLACGAPTLMEAYEAALRLLELPALPARLHLIAHLVRDIANGLPEVVTGTRFEKFEQKNALDSLAHAWEHERPSPPVCGDPEQPAPGSPTVTLSAQLVDQVARVVRDHQRVRHTRREQTAELMAVLRPRSREIRPALEPVIRGWLKDVDWFMGHAHVPRRVDVRRPDEAEIQRRFRSFEDGLRGLLDGHFAVVRELDAILTSQPAGEQAVQRARPFLAGAEQLRYFFYHPRLHDPAWLPVLEQAGFFAQAPPPTVHEQDGMVNHWGWPASVYLAHMARQTEAQADVARIAAKVKTNNVRVQDDLAQIALALPANLAAGLAPGLARALRAHPQSLLTRPIAALAEKLALGDRPRDAGRLLGALFEVLPDRSPSATDRFAAMPTTRVSPHRLNDLFGPHLPGVVDGLGIKALPIFCGALARAVRLSGQDEPDEDAEDYSHVWRPDLAEDGRLDARDVLVTIARRAAEHLAAQDASLIPAIAEKLEGYGWLIFRRLVLHALLQVVEPPDELVASRLLDRSLFDRFRTCPEYRALLQRHFARLNSEQAATLLGWIDAGRSADDVRASLEFWEGATPDAVRIGAEQRRWQWRRLLLIRAALPADWVARADALAQEFGTLPEDETAPAGRFGAVGWPSPLTSDEVHSMSVAKLTTFLSSWKVTEDQPLAGPAGLGEVIAEAVERSPQRFASEATAFRGLKPTYVRAVLEGLCRALKGKRTFPWAPVLALAEWLLEQPCEEPEPEWNMNDDPGWGWARGATTTLLSEALQADPSPLSADFRTRVWALLEAACGDPDPQRRARVVEAAVSYAQWVRVQAGQAWSGPGTLDDVPEVRLALDAALDLDTSPSDAVHEAVGGRLPWLVFMDEGWVRSRLSSIFPTALEHDELWKAAWQAYLQSGAPLNDRVVGVLLPVYHQAVQRLSPESEDHRADRDPMAERLAEDLMYLYGRGSLAGEEANRLLPAFHERAPVRLRRYALWYAGHSLREQQEEVPPEVLKRFQALWCGRRELISTVPSTAEELLAFGTWFAYDGFDAAWRLEQLEFVLDEIGPVDHDHLVAKELARMIEQHLTGVTRCFGLLVSRLPDVQPVYGWDEAVPAILAAALRSADTAVQDEALRAYHQLGSLGLRRQELLPFSQDLDDQVAIPDFTWDHPMTVAEIRRRLANASEPERDRLLGQILREAKDTDVWRFTTPEEVARSWARVERHLGRRRSFWALLLGEWREQGLLVG